jgi:hypothetical protein
MYYAVDAGLAVAYSFVPYYHSNWNAPSDSEDSSGMIVIALLDPWYNGAQLPGPEMARPVRSVKSWYRSRSRSLHRITRSHKTRRTFLVTVSWGDLIMNRELSMKFKSQNNTSRPLGEICTPNEVRSEVNIADFPLAVPIQAFRVTSEWRPPAHARAQFSRSPLLIPMH